jgi:Bardet-Biedl syndrome 9 protein
MALLTGVLGVRLEKFHNAADAKTRGAGGSEKKEAFAVAFTEPLPFHDLFLLLDAHFEERKRMAELHATVEKAATQFRVVQKRLLVRMKDKKPTLIPLPYKLMADTHARLLELGGAVDLCSAALRKSAQSLACGLSLFTLLLKYKFNLDQQNAHQLKLYFSAIVKDNDEQGWEEQCDGAVKQLLRTAFAKSSREAQTVVAPLAPLPDTERLKKHIQIVCERLGKGQRLVTAKEQLEGNPKKTGGSSKGRSSSSRSKRNEEN